MWKTADVLLSSLAVLIGFLGIYLAVRAVDLGFQIFSGILIAFAVIYFVGTVRRIYPGH